MPFASTDVEILWIESLAFINPSTQQGQIWLEGRTGVSIVHLIQALYAIQVAWTTGLVIVHTTESLYISYRMVSNPGK
jgi:hypothetical protein